MTVAMEDKNVKLIRNLESPTNISPLLGYCAGGWTVTKTEAGNHCSMFPLSPCCAVCVPVCFKESAMAKDVFLVCGRQKTSLRSAVCCAWLLNALFALFD